MWGSATQQCSLHNSGRASLGPVLQCVGQPAAGVGFDYIMTARPTPNHLVAASPVFGCGVSFFFFLMGSSVLLSVVVPQLAVILVLLPEMSSRPSTVPS